MQVKAFPNAKYKAFESKEEAHIAFHQIYSEKPKSEIKKIKQWTEEVNRNAIAVDAACSGNPGDLEYRGVFLDNGTEFFHVGPFKKGTNNVGEFLAIVHALALMKKEGKESIPIYSDSKIAMNWVKLKHPATKLKFDASNRILEDLLKRAVDWLHHNRYANPVLKWETEKWGENPADFGRK